jgi:hypothetical protein
MRDSRWLVTRDEEYQGRRVHGIEVEEVAVPYLCRDLWFRFADIEGGIAWRCWVYGYRLDAVVNATERALDHSEDIDKAMYKMPQEMVLLAFRSSLRLKILDCGSQPLPWEGEVFSCVYTASPSEEK